MNGREKYWRAVLVGGLVAGALGFCIWNLAHHMSGGDSSVAVSARGGCDVDVHASGRGTSFGHHTAKATPILCPPASSDLGRRVAVVKSRPNTDAMPESKVDNLSGLMPSHMAPSKRAQMASDKNQLMDELLNQPVIPGDYGAQMIALFRDQKQDVVTRDFAVQHMGLYAQALNRRGTYSPDSAEARALRSALDEAVGETKSIVSAAAFRALADIAAFDPHVDGRRLDARLAACVTDSAAAPAARVMAAQLCGERRIASARPMLAALAADHAAPEMLRRSAAYAVSLLDAK